MSIPHGLKKQAAMVLLRHRNEFLLLKRSRQPNRGKFVPVGGKLEPFESPVRAARRETREESGFELEKLDFCGVLVESSPTDYNWTCHIYMAEVARITPPACEEGAFFWIPFPELETLNTPPTDWWIYRMAVRGQPFVLNAEYDGDLNLRFMEEEISGKRLV